MAKQSLYVSVQNAAIPEEASQSCRDRSRKATAAVALMINEEEMKDCAADIDVVMDAMRSS